MNSQKPKTINYELRIGEKIDGFVIGIDPPPSRQAITTITNFLNKRITNLPEPIQSTTVFSKQNHVEWFIPGKSESRVFIEATELRKSVSLDNGLLSISDKPTQQINNKALFDED